MTDLNIQFMMEQTTQTMPVTVGIIHFDTDICYIQYEINTIMMDIFLVDINKDRMARLRQFQSSCLWISSQSWTRTSRWHCRNHRIENKMLQNSFSLISKSEVFQLFSPCINHFENINCMLKTMQNIYLFKLFICWIEI